MSNKTDTSSDGVTSEGNAPDRCLPLYNLLLSANDGNGWSNPVFHPNAGVHENDFFQVIVDDFLEIVGCPQVQIYRINKRWGKTEIFCRRENDQTS